ncbi:MAG: transcriptional regulator-like protein [Verrucomicrobiales bacterium]|nr:transcriptional regulator-like protein [Verrucomicrobiales bacterium]
MNKGGEGINSKPDFTASKQVLIHGATPSERQQFDRLNKMHSFFNSGGKTNAPELMKTFGVSDRTIWRMFEILIDDWGMPLVHDKKLKKSYYSHTVSDFPGRMATEGDIFTLMLANGALRECVTDEQRMIVSKTFRKIADNYQDAISFDFDYLDNCVSFCDTAKSIFEPNLLQLLLRCIAKRRKLRIRYDTPHQKPVYRTIDSYHLRKVDADWLLFVYDYYRNKVIRLALPRIHEVEELDETFIRPIGFRVENFLKGAFGTYAGEETYPVIVRVTKREAHRIREKIWPCQKKLVELPDGSVELHMELSSLMDVHPWILSFDGQAAPVAPFELQTMFENANRNGMSLLQKIQMEQRQK